MSPIYSQNSHDLLPVDVIPVIASFSDDGHIKPIYVQINGESYKVSSSWCRQNYAGQIEFHCKLVVDNYLQPVIITYYVTDCIWTIPKK